MKSHSVNEHFVRKVLVAQSCLTLCQPADCSPPGFSVHVIPQARILPFPSPEDLPNPGIKPSLLWLLHCMWILYNPEPLGKPLFPRVRV